jgi:hypothetical protein
VSRPFSNSEGMFRRLWHDQEKTGVLVDLHQPSWPSPDRL